MQKSGFDHYNCITGPVLTLLLLQVWLFNITETILIRRLNWAGSTCVSVDRHIRDLYMCFQTASMHPQRNECETLCPWTQRWCLCRGAVMLQDPISALSCCLHHRAVFSYPGCSRLWRSVWCSAITDVKNSVIVFKKGFGMGQRWCCRFFHVVKRINSNREAGEAFQQRRRNDVLFKNRVIASSIYEHSPSHRCFCCHGAEEPFGSSCRSSPFTANHSPMTKSWTY